MPYQQDNIKQGVTIQLRQDTKQGLTYYKERLGMTWDRLLSEILEDIKQEDKATTEADKELNLSEDL